MHARRETTAAEGMGMLRMGRAGKEKAKRRWLDEGAQERKEIGAYPGWRLSGQSRAERDRQRREIGERPSVIS